MKMRKNQGEPLSRALAVAISCPHATPRLYSELVKRQDGTHRGGTKLLSDPHDGLLPVSLLEAPVRQMSTGPFCRDLGIAPGGRSRKEIILQSLEGEDQGSWKPLSGTYSLPWLCGDRENVEDLSC